MEWEKSKTEKWRLYDEIPQHVTSLRTISWKLTRLELLSNTPRHCSKRIKMVKGCKRALNLKKLVFMAKNGTYTEF